ncbi:uncharacterized protein BKCO1_23000139 [Diplodia corticola]|uniref:Uncharacterized protein n=1 Tax=Diplodia corticola TaxID=236234 RepID=A0A1J9R2I8_9PEZI|nr:uncharacterized protein BKCO1_23000139 [Diplodia corticola]OJD34458.1 hypothetical protein BKCO1_23000139 [Diplodia corticola]
MATCFRGAVPFARPAFFQLPRSVAFQYRQPSPFATLRFFTASPLRAASKKAASRVATPAPKAARAPAVQLEYQSKADFLGKGRKWVEITSETLLYSAPKQRGFRIACYAAAFACFGAAASSYQFFYNDLKDKTERDGLASWVPLSFGFIAVFWAFIGTWLAAAPMGIVKSISVIPKRGAQKSLVLRFEIMRLPGMSNKVQYAAPAEVRADSSIAATTVEYAVARQVVEDSRKPRPDDPKLLKPFLALGRWVSRFFYNLMIYTKMSTMREGIVKVRMGNKVIGKVDCSGELPKGGYVIDQVIKPF